MYDSRTRPNRIKSKTRWKSRISLRRPGRVILLISMINENQNEREYQLSYVMDTWYT